MVPAPPDGWAAMGGGGASAGSMLGGLDSGGVGPGGGAGGTAPAHLLNWVYLTLADHSAQHQPHHQVCTHTNAIVFTPPKHDSMHHELYRGSLTMTTWDLLLQWRARVGHNFKWAARGVNLVG